MRRWDSGLTVDDVAELMRLSPKSVTRDAARQFEASRLTQARGGCRIKPETVDASLDARSDKALPAGLPRDLTRRGGPAMLRRPSPFDAVVVGVCVEHFVLPRPRCAAAG